MTKRACCCGGGVPEPPGVTGSFCCNPIFFTDFITLYGDDMADHAEVSPQDWIGLVVKRPPIAKADFVRSHEPPDGCNCCCADCTTGPNQQPLTSNPSDFEVDPTNDGRYRRSFNKLKTFINSSISNRKKQTKKSIQITSKQSGAAVKPEDENLQYIVKLDRAIHGKDIGADLNGVNHNTNTFAMIEDGDGGLEVEGPDYGGGLGNWDPDNPPPEVPCFKHVGAWLAGDYTSPLHKKCNAMCCKAEEYSTSARGANDVFFAYKYSGCHLTWYPREFSFDKDPYVPQCTGVLTWQVKCIDPPACNSIQYRPAQNSCSGWALQRFGIGAAGSFNYQEECSYTTFWERMTDLRFPCACAPFPHIHGGIKDSLYNRINVRLSPGQMGYVSKMYPLSEPMTGRDEAGCCWVSNSQLPGNWSDYSNNRSACFKSTYPYFDGRGKRPENIISCGPGFRGHYIQPAGGIGGSDDYIVGNPNYNTSCYEWGISPYLQRISTKYNKMGLEIFKHGRFGGHLQDYGTVFEVSRYEKLELLRDIQISFGRKPGKKSSLRQQFVGFIQLEHHFECYAFRSEDGTAVIEMNAIQNHCNMLIPKSERGYGGKYTQTAGGCYRWTPWQYDSNLWQIKRSVPRRVMYAGSGIPLFQFDLVNMEQKLLTNPELGAGCPGAFTPEDFLSHYYRYYYGMISWSGKECKEFNRPPEPLEWDYGHFIDSYNYVSCWLEKMIECGILRIKDHSIDIAEETNNIIAAGTIFVNPETQEEEILIPEQVAIECGGVAGYEQLVQFWGASVGASDAVTPKLVKEKLFNPAGVSRVDNETNNNLYYSSPNEGTIRLFLPRRARLPLGSARAGITAWGCASGFSANNQYENFICPSYVGPNNPNGSEYGNSLKIPEQFFVPHEENSPYAVYNLLRHEKVYSNFAGTFIQDASGKLSFFFGGVPYGDNSDPVTYELTSGDLKCPPEGQDPFDIIVGRYGLYPGAIQCVPLYLSTSTLFSVCEDDTTGESYICPANPIDIWDGRVVDLCFTHKFAVALCDFERKAFSVVCGVEGGQIINPAYEIGGTPPTAIELDFPGPAFTIYNAFNCNGPNMAVPFSPCDFPTCLINEPFNYAPCGGAGAVVGARTFYPEPPFEGYRLKSWGKWAGLLGTFSVSYEDAVAHSNDSHSYAFYGYNYPRDSQFRGYDPNIHGVTLDKDGNTRQANLRYPGTNTWNIWTKIGCGLYHFAALDDYGGLFITPQSSNLEGQSAHGIPYEYNSLYNFLADSEDLPGDVLWKYDGFGPFFNYYNHIPRPGFIKEEEWTPLRYNMITYFSSTYRQKHCICAPYAGSWIDLPQYCEPNPVNPGSVGGSEPGCKDCQTSFITKPVPNPDNPNTNICGICFGQEVGNLYLPWRDRTCFYMGSLVQGNGFAGSTAFFFGFSETQPHYKDLACGAFNTMLLTNENKIEIYGTYLQVDENGVVVGPRVDEYDDDGNIVNSTLIPVEPWVPEQVKALKGVWECEYACPMYCAMDSNDPPRFTQDLQGYTLPPCYSGMTFSPLIGATYNPPNFEDRIKTIKSAADYSLCVTNGNIIHVWGEASMIPGYNKDTYYPGTKAYAKIGKLELGVPEDSSYTITEVTTGIHAFYIAYKIVIPNSSFTYNKIYSFTRYGNETTKLEAPGSLQGKEIISMSAGNGFAVALYGQGIEPKKWDAESFAVENRIEGWQLNHLDYQYKNFSSIPEYHQRDAFFHAIPGQWDVSKFLWGGNCCNSITNPRHPTQEEDRCAALAYNIYTDPGVFGYDYTGVSDSLITFKPTNANNCNCIGTTFVNFNIVEDTHGFTSGQILSAVARMSPAGGQTLSISGYVVGYTGHTYDNYKTLSISVAGGQFIFFDDNYGWDPVQNTAGGQVRGENDVWDIKLDDQFRFNKNLSYSGHPEHLWMRSDIRRLTEQSLNLLKNVTSSAVDNVGQLACTPGGVIDISAQAVGGLAALYGGCLADLGSCWGEARPMKERVLYQQQIPFPDCMPGSACEPELNIKNRGTVVDAEGSVLSTGVYAPNPEAYRADKDTFQKVSHHYGPTRIGNDLCTRHKSKSLSYFKYCERHYYFGHDTEKDTWEIYESPDILRNMAVNDITGNTYEPLPGLTGATVAGPSGGFGQGSCGPISLSSYPKAGPNYPRRDWVYWPSFFLSDAFIARSIAWNVCAGEDPDYPCDSPCLAGQYASSKVYQILANGGIGAIVWGSPCNRPGTTFLGETEDIGKMWNKYITYNSLHYTATPATILWGVKNDINAVIPPDEDPNFEKKGFLKVLVDEQYTAMFEPYRDTSKRWHPLCWESASDYGDRYGTPGSVNCFVGIDNVSCIELDPNNVVLDIETGNAFCTPASCLLYECCPPPSIG